MKTPLLKEFEYYLANQNELVRKYRGKFIVIKNLTVVGAYDSEIVAVEESAKKYPKGTFLVQKCEPGDEEYTETFHSRAVFC